MHDRDYTLLHYSIAGVKWKIPMSLVMTGAEAYFQIHRLVSVLRIKKHRLVSDYGNEMHSITVLN